MGVSEAIKNLETSNVELRETMEQLGEQFQDLREDPKFGSMVDDLEKLAFNYLSTWIKTNTDVLDILYKEKI